MNLKNNADQEALQTVGLGLTSDEARELAGVLRELLREPNSPQLVSDGNGREIAVWIED
jgi:hypothetical protein